MSPQRPSMFNASRIEWLWQHRLVTNFRMLMPYYLDVIRSGFITFAFISFIVFMFFYARWVRDLPDGIFLSWIPALVIWPLLYRSHFRTYLKEADLIYLVPRESQMSPYFKRSLALSFTWQMVTLTLVLLITWPLYLKSNIDGQFTFFIIFLILMAGKSLNLYVSWMEAQLVWNDTRVKFQITRFVFTGIGLLALFVLHPYQGVLIFFLLHLINVISIRFAKAYILNWKRLITMEQQSIARIFSFISWFADVPESMKRIHRRALVNRLLTIRLFDRSQTYLFLYLKTFLRSESYGMVNRMLLVGVVIVWIFGDSWLQPLFYWGFLHLIGMQLSSLEQSHKHMAWIHVYPLQEELRLDSLVKIGFRLHVIVAVLLTIPVLLHFNWTLFLVCAVIGAGWPYYYFYRLCKNKWLKEMTCT